MLDKKIKEAKLIYEHDQITMNINNNKYLWRVINFKLGKKDKKYTNINYICDENNLKIQDSDKISNYMNSYFCNIGRKLSAKIQKPLNSSIHLPHANQNTIFIAPTNEHEVELIIRNLKFKNGGVDRINAKTIKILSKFILSPLVHIINLSIEKSIWPNALKMLI